ncbi:Protein DSE1 [Yarrowia sp. B02]|nr:Protein DSE1 [Yarrowia sp. B02]
METLTHSLGDLSLSTSRYRAKRHHRTKSASSIKRNQSIRRHSRTLSTYDSSNPYTDPSSSYAQLAMGRREAKPRPKSYAEPTSSSRPHHHRSKSHTNPRLRFELRAQTHESYSYLPDEPSPCFDQPSFSWLEEAESQLSELTRKYTPEPMAASQSLSWTIPDESHYLTSVAVHESSPLIAVGSGGKENNLFVYETTHDKGLIHHQTISLPAIHGLKWLSPSQQVADLGNILATSHSNGLAHLVLLPDCYSSDPAEILKRFNHKHHVSMKDTLSTRIKHLELTTPAWRSSVSSSLATLYSQHLFLWDPSRGDTPVLTRKVKRAEAFSLSPFQDGQVAAACGKYTSLVDLRAKSGSVNLLAANTSLAAYSPMNSNLLATAHSDSSGLQDNCVRIWDSRHTAGPLHKLEGHSDQIRSLEWSKFNPCELHTSSNDGSLRLWNIGRQQETKPAPKLEVYSGDLSAQWDEQKASAQWLPKSARQMQQRGLAFNVAPLNIQKKDMKDRKLYSSSVIAKTPHAAVASASFMPTGSMHPSVVTVDSYGSLGIHALPSATPYAAEPEGRTLTARMSVQSFASTDMSSDFTEADLSSASDTSPMASPSLANSATFDSPVKSAFDAHPATYETSVSSSYIPPLQIKKRVPSGPRPETHVRRSSRDARNLLPELDLDFDFGLTA